MAEAFDTRELGEALQPERDADFFPLNDLPNDVLVSVFMAVEDPTWMRHTFPLVCKAWNELYLTKDASPLHETLEVDFGKEVGVVAREWVLPVVHASRVLAWAERRAGSVRKLLLRYGWLRKAMEGDRPLQDFKAKDLGALVAVVGSSLTGISIGSGLHELLKRPFWESLRDSVVPFGLLRSLVVEDIDSTLLESDVEPLLGQLAGSLEELELKADYRSEDRGLPRFPEPFFALEKLRRLALDGHPRIRAIPAGISSLKKLEDLELRHFGLSSLPKELGELSRLTSLALGGNWNLGTALPADEAFPAELGNMKCLRELKLSHCRLRTVPAFVGQLKSLESLTLQQNDLSSLPKELGELSGLTKLDLSCNGSLGNTLPVEEAFPAELGKMKSLRELELYECCLRAVPSFVGELKSLESLTLQTNYLSSLPKELGELSRLTKLELSRNRRLGTTLPADEAFPAELGNMKSLRELFLVCCLRAVPSFVGELESLEVLNLDLNSKLQIDAPLDFLIEGCPRLREVTLIKRPGRDPGGNLWTPRSLANLEAFKAKLRAKNPNANVIG